MSVMNLLPEYYVKQRFRRRVDILCTVLFAMVMGGVIVGGTLQGRRYRQTREQHEWISRQFRQEAAMLEEFLRLRGEKRKLADAARETSDLEETLPRSYLVAAVARALPKDASLSVMEICEQITVKAPAVANPKAPNTPAAKTKPSPSRPPAAGNTQVTRSRDRKAGNEPPVPPKPQWVVKIAGFAAGDSDVAQIYTTLKSLPITEEVQLRHSREAEGQALPRREFQIDWTLKRNVDVLEHLSADMGVIEVPATIAGEEKKDG